MVLTKINITHRRWEMRRLCEGDGLFTEKLATGLDPSFLDQYSARTRRRPRGANLSLLPCAGERHIFAHLLHISFEKKWSIWHLEIQQTFATPRACYEWHDTQSSIPTKFPKITLSRRFDLSSMLSSIEILMTMVCVHRNLKAMLFFRKSIIL